MERRKVGRSKQLFRVTLCFFHNLGFSLHVLFSNMIAHEGELTSHSKLSFYCSVDSHQTPKTIARVQVHSQNNIAALIPKAVSSHTCPASPSL